MTSVKLILECILATLILFYFLSSQRGNKIIFLILAFPLSQIEQMHAEPTKFSSHFSFHLHCSVAATDPKVFRKSQGNYLNFLYEYYFDVFLKYNLIYYYLALNLFFKEDFFVKFIYSWVPVPVVIIAGSIISSGTLDPNHLLIHQDKQPSYNYISLLSGPVKFYVF